jgi:hypothetical protein
MRNGLLLALAVITAEGVAYACSCMVTDDPAQLREFAGEAASGAIALVDAEALTAFQHGGSGERMAVRRTLAGSAPSEFQVERGPMPSSASCDDLYQAGQRKIVILYPARAAAGAIPVYRTSGLCTNLLLDKPTFRDAVAEHIGGAARPGERG